MKKIKQSFSKEYKFIKNEIETTWADWKIKFYNDYCAIFAHAKKLKRKGIKNNENGLC